MKQVFLDANIVIELGTPPYGPLFARVIDLIATEQIKMLTTNLTGAEVTNHHTRRDFDEMKCICRPKFRKIVKGTINTEFPMITEKQLRKVLRKKYSGIVKDIFNQMNAKLLKVGEVNPNAVFSEYFNERGLFADGQGKKHQFPDAFILERLKDEASQTKPIIVVSKDKDFERPVNDQEHITLVKSLPCLFKKLGLKLEDPEIEDFLGQNFDVLTELVNDELSTCWLEGDIKYSEITETEVIDIDFQDIIAFESAEGGPTLVVGKIYALTIVDFTYPGAGTIKYDSKGKHRKYFETVHSQSECELEIDVSLSIAVDDEGDPVKIEDLEFRNDDFTYIQLSPLGHYW